MEDRKRLVQREESVRLSPHVYLMSILNLTGVCGTATHRRAAGVCVCLCGCVCYTQCVLTAGLLGRVISLLSSLASWPSVLEAELPKTQTQEDVFHKTAELAKIGEDRTLRKQFKGTFCNYPLQISPLGGSISTVGLVSLPKSKIIN